MGGIDFTQIMELMQLFNLQTEENKNNLESVEQEDEPEKYSPIIFDEELQTQNMKMVKSIIPFLDLRHQKLIGTAIKFMEIQKLMQKKEEVSIAALNPRQQREDILKAVRPYCSKSQRDNIDMIMKLFEMKEILEQAEQLKELMG